MRQPQNVHVYLYRKRAQRKRAQGEYEYAVFQRADAPYCWQGVSGGVEEGETLEYAAQRESLEEAGTPASLPLERLDTISYIPAAEFSAHTQWGASVTHVPMYYFAAAYHGEIVLSHEHTAVQWLAYESALALVYWDDQKAALKELHTRLTGIMNERVENRN